MLRVIGTEPTSKFSKVRVTCKCDCGNPDEISVRWNTFAGRTPSCGECAVWRWKKTGVTKYGKLTLSCPVEEVKTMGRTPLPWQCDCGNSKMIPLNRVVSGNTTSCGCAYDDMRKTRKVVRHPEKTKEEWMAEVPELLPEDLPERWSFRTRMRPSFSCSCGKTHSMTFWAFRTGKTKCGKCDVELMRSGDVVNGFIYDGPDAEIDKRSLDKVPFLCAKCGQRDEFQVRYVMKGNYARCSKCNVINAEEMSSRMFGRLKLKEVKSVSRYSMEKTKWLCECGNETTATVSNVVNGTTKSCGNCRDIVSKWHKTNIDTIKSIRCPFNPEDLPPGGVVPLETVQTTKKPFKAECPVCKSEYEPRWEGIRNGVSLTCGCSSNRVSSGQNEMKEFVESLGIEAVLEHKVGTLKYDVFVPSQNMLLEYNGLRWHSMEDSRTRDFNKFKNAEAHNMGFVSVFEDEWMKRKDVVKTFLKNRMGLTKTTALRLSKTEIRDVDSISADMFYDKFHYIGPCKPGKSYGVFFKGNMIACASFSHPTRQSKHEWELVRMSSCPEFRVHGVWSKILKIFREEHKPKSIVSFSDNRLFNGGVYEKIGFRLDGEVRPDYYWVIGNVRRHKSGLRKKKGEVGTETELRTAQGYQKIWDVGKKRWVFEG